jgi:CO/xanthine dehydrogenase Mo-binding subunit
VKVLRVAAAQDVGYALNPEAVEAQLEGGVLQGVGEAVYEELTTRDGQVTNPDFCRYAVPTALDAPEVMVDILESRKAEGIAGVKGVGEAPVCPTPAAVANAVRDAIGAPVRKLPLSGENVLEVMDSAFRSLT